MSLTRSENILYMQAAESLRDNASQWQAYESVGHCVLLAGPGSGKTKTLTLKLARMLSESIEAPRGLACITYSNECARELENRLRQLGVESGGRVFIGTVHSFSLTQILLPYAKVARLELPENFTIANRQQTREVLEIAFKEVIGGPENPQDWAFRLAHHRRRFLNRKRPEWRTTDPQMTLLVEAYEKELRKRGLIDFDDMPLLAVRALHENRWLRKALVAKYPVLAVDEYQDLGIALHEIVLQLCFGAGMRLFAVGDVDQSIYGFTGSDPILLSQLAKRHDVETIRLGLNYRCGRKIVNASEYVLGENRNYRTPNNSHEGSIYFHPRNEEISKQAYYLIDHLIPEIQKRHPNSHLGNIAVLYPAAFLGDEIGKVAKERGYKVTRADTNALYPRSSKLMRWLELCAIWCCNGWRAGVPRASQVMRDGTNIFYDVLSEEKERLKFQQTLIKVLWDRRDGAMSLYLWLVELCRDIITPLVSRSRLLSDEYEILRSFMEEIGPDGNIDDFTLGGFAGLGNGIESIQLSTLHSSKGREFDVVILFAIEEGKLPRRRSGRDAIAEARRLFYVGFTRARYEVHLIYNERNESRFVTELLERMGDS